MYNTEERLVRSEKEYFERRIVIEGMLLLVVLALALLLLSIRVFALGALMVLFPLYLIDLSRFMSLRSRYQKISRD